MVLPYDKKGYRMIIDKYCPL